MGDTLKQAKFVLQTKESAEKRFNAAIKSLSLIRKMLPSGVSTDASPGDKTASATNSTPKANGSPIKISPLATVPPVSNGKNGHSPTNRISQHFAPKPNGHMSRLRVFPEDGAADEKHETQLT